MQTAPYSDSALRCLAAASVANELCIISFQLRAAPCCAGAFSLIQEWGQGARGRLSGMEPEVQEVTYQTITLLGVTHVCQKDVLPLGEAVIAR